MANLQEETGVLTSRFKMKDLPQDVAKMVEQLQDLIRDHNLSDEVELFGAFEISPVSLS